MLTTIMLPILWCIIISIIFGIKLLNYNQLSAVNIVVEQTLIDNIFTSQDLVLSLIGLAISVWIGLNIYNALSKEELKDLLDKAEHATKITERIYTEVLLSKFRMSPADRTVSYLASRLETIDLLPAEILENLIAVEDLFSFSYGLYEGGMASPYNHEGIDKIRTFMDEANEFKCEKKSHLNNMPLLWGIFRYDWRIFLILLHNIAIVLKRKRGAALKLQFKDTKTRFPFYLILEILLFAIIRIYTYQKNDRAWHS